jgi:hypothetical protein
MSPILLTSYIYTLSNHMQKVYHKAMAVQIPGGQFWQQIIKDFRTVMSRDSSVGIATGYWLDDWMIGIRFLKGAGNFSLRHHVHTDSGAHPASYPMGIGVSSPGGKAAGAWGWPLASIYSRGQRMRGAILSLPNYIFMAWCLVKHRESFTSTFRSVTVCFYILSTMTYSNNAQYMLTIIHNLLNINVHT